jgi:5-dehydro-2-deoxygluconokinase
VAGDPEPAPGPQLEVVTIGRISVDLYPVEAGPMRDVRTLAKSVGGTATNVAVAAARLGRRAAVVTRVGDDAFGDDVRHALAERFGVDTRFVGIDPSLPTSLAFAELDPPEDPRIIFYRYPAAPDMQLTPGDLAPVPIEDVAILWVPASCFSAEPSRATVRGALARRARRRHTIVDLDWRPVFWTSEADATAQLREVLPLATVAIGNREECRVAVGSADPEVAAERLLGTGLEAAVVKLGGDGVLVAGSDGTRELVAPYPVEVVCGLGAGDAFGGALCHGLLGGASLAEAVRVANAAGAIVASRLLCAEAMPTAAELDAFLAVRA